MTIGELRALPVGRGQIGEVRILPVGVPPRGRGSNKGARDVTASIARIGVKLPSVGQHQEKRGYSRSVDEEELESLKPVISENPWVKNDVSRNKLLEKVKSFVSTEDDQQRFEDSVPPEERNSTKREELRRELDEVLRGIRETGGVGAICRDREENPIKLTKEIELQKERRRQEKLWRRPQSPKDFVSVESKVDCQDLQDGKVVESSKAAYKDIMDECKNMINHNKNDMQKIDKTSTFIEKRENKLQKIQDNVASKNGSDVSSETGSSTSETGSDSEDEELQRVIDSDDDEPYISITPL